MAFLWHEQIRKLNLKEGIFRKYHFLVKVTFNEWHTSLSESEVF